MITKHSKKLIQKIDLSLTSDPCDPLKSIKKLNNSMISTILNKKHLILKDN